MNNIKIVSIKRAKINWMPVKIYAVVQSRTRPVVKHNVNYIRSEHMRRWTCTCEDFLFRLLGINRNCDHIKHIRAKYGRFGEKV